MSNRLAPIALAATAAACGPPSPPPPPETIFTLSPSTWFEDGWSHYRVSPDGRRAVFGARFGRRLLDLERGVEDTAAWRGSLEAVDNLVFDPRGAAIREGRLGPDTAWYAETQEGPRRLAIPPGVMPSLAPDGWHVAWYTPGQASLTLGPVEGATPRPVSGEVTGLGWSPGSDAVLALVLERDGSSTLIRVPVGGEAARIVARGLDAPPRFSGIGVAPDGRIAYLALAGDTAPNDTARQRPDADRDTDLYAVDLATGRLRQVLETPGDDFHPQVVQEALYWTHNELHDDVVVLPIEGDGDPRVVASAGQLPVWGPGGQLAYTVGGWRIADWGLNLDAVVVTLDAAARPIGSPQPIVVGTHEDFTPAWSPGGRWIAYHSHRSPAPVPGYAAPGATDDLYLRRPEAPMEDERRLTDFGWEVGTADWAPDGRRLVFDSWDRGRAPGSKPWILTLDPATGAVRRLERMPLPSAVPATLFLAWSPRRDREEIALIAAGEGSRQSLWLTAPGGGAAAAGRKLADFESGTYGGLDWTPDGEEIIYGARGADGRMQLFAIRRSGGAPRQLTRDPSGLLHPQVSPDGRWIAATRIRRAMELRRLARLP